MTNISSKSSQKLKPGEDKKCKKRKQIINQNIKGSIYGHKEDSLCQKSHLKPTHLTLNGPNW